MAFLEIPIYLWVNMILKVNHQALFDTWKEWEICMKEIMMDIRYIALYMEKQQYRMT